MILSDRVFVMNAGRIAQDGSPRQIYEQPRTRFVMDFLGQVDHVDARVVRPPDGAYVARLDGVQGLRSVPLATDQPWHDGEAVVLALRSSDVRVCAVDGNGSWQGTIVSTIYLGERVEYVVELGTAHVRASGPVTDSFSAGATVQLQIPAGAIRAWPTHPSVDDGRRRVTTRPVAARQGEDTVKHRDVCWRWWCSGLSWPSPAGTMAQTKAWDETVAAAKKEGVVVWSFFGAPGAATERQAASSSVSTASASSWCPAAPVISKPAGTPSARRESRASTCARRAVPRTAASRRGASIKRSGRCRPRSRPASRGSWTRSWT